MMAFLVLRQERTFPTRFAWRPLSGSLSMGLQRRLERPAVGRVGGMSPSGATVHPKDPSLSAQGQCGPLKL